MKDLRASRQKLRERHSAHEAQLERFRTRADHLEREIANLKVQNEDLREHIRAMENSATWRLFGP